MGLEFALKGTHVTTAPSSADDSSNEQHEEPSANLLQHFRHQDSEGYEVYQEHDDDRSTPDYGPVISGMIARYSQERQGQQRRHISARPFTQDDLAQGNYQQRRHISAR